MHRFIDQGISPYSFTEYPIFVKCPFCHKHAIIFQQKQTNPSEQKAVFSCQFCCKSFDQQVQQENNLGYFAGAYLHIDEKCTCKQGKFVCHQYYPKISFIPPSIKLKCNFCLIQRQIYPQPFQIWREHSYEVNLDPYFAYRLYLTTETRHGLIFVYNIEQLNCLKAYVSANLRERKFPNYNRSYFSRLPAWIKSTRNRKEILKAVLRLEQMASTIQPLTNK